MIDCLVYFVVFGLVFVLNILAVRQKNSKLKYILIGLGFLILLLFIGFRYNVGVDYKSYLSSYNSVANTSWDKILSLRMEPLVSFIFKVCSYILQDSRLIFLVLGFLLLLPLYMANKVYNNKYLAYSVLTFCVLFLPFGLNGMRQGIAMSFALLALVYFAKNKNKKGLFSFIISAFFHTSALIMLPYIIAIWFCRKKNIKFTTINIILTTIVSLALFFFLNGILLDNGITKYSYMLSEIGTEEVSLSGFLIYAPIMILALVFAGDREERTELSIYKNFMMTGLLFYTIGTTAQYLTRFSYFFLLPMIMLSSILIQNISNKRDRIIVKILYIIYLIVFFYLQYYVSGRHGIMPYQTWLLGGGI